MTAEAPDRFTTGHVASRTDVVGSWTTTSRVALPRLGRFSYKQWIIATLLVVIAVIDMTRGFSLIVTSVSTMQHGPGGTSIRQVVADNPQPAHANIRVSAKD